MHDAGEFRPAAERTALRALGATFAPRLTTTDEQLREARKHLESVLLASGHIAGFVLVHWTRYPPSRIEVHGHVEHLTLDTGVESLFVTDRVVQFTPEGATIPRDEHARLARLKAELAELRDHAAGPT